jgi:hypothetical protein
MLQSTSLGGLMMVAALADGADGRTILNSVLGALRGASPLHRLCMQCMEMSNAHWCSYR